jgi:DNA polymerase V
MRCPDKKNIYRDFIINSSDRFLYESAKKFLIQLHSGYEENAWKNEIIYDECAGRSVAIFENAIEDALLFVNSLEFRSGFMKVLNIKRIDHMSKTELIDFVDRSFHAGWNNPDGTPAENNSEMKKSEILKSFGIKHGTVLCTVSGSSMVEARIFDGDTLIADTDAVPKNRDIVIVNLDGETFVKRYIIEDDRIVLVSENPEYRDLMVAEESNFQILGVVTGSVTNFNN